jgi:hypothetical protein
MLCGPCSSLLDGLKTEEGLRNFFKNNKKDMRREEAPFCEDINSSAAAVPDKNSKKKKIYPKTNSKHFLVPKPPFEDRAALQRQKFLLAKALWNRNLMFDDNLSYSKFDCPKELNDASLEPNLEVIIMFFVLERVKRPTTTLLGVG